jgi:polysaccharide export outer membrane protein
MGNPPNKLYVTFPSLLLALSIVFAGCASSGRTASQTSQKDDTLRKEYVIGPEDVLEISVWQNEDVSRVVAVRPDGKISLPLIHDIQAAGLTAAELKEVVTQELKPYVETPEVTVIVEQINSWRIYVQGEVQNPGAYPIRSHTTVSQVISMVGGLTEFAKESKILVVRNRGGERETIKVNYNRIVNGKSPDQDVYLQPGDTIIVP